jgi:hypothetical protein
MTSHMSILSSGFRLLMPGKNACHPASNVTTLSQLGSSVCIDTHLCIYGLLRESYSESSGPIECTKFID